MFILVIVKVQGKVLSVCLFLSVFYFSGEIPNSDQRRLLGYTGPVFTGLRAREGWLWGLLFEGVVSTQRFFSL